MCNCVLIYSYLFVFFLQLEFKQLHGHCDVPQNYAPNPSLGIWVNKVSRHSFLKYRLLIIDHNTRTHNAHLLSVSYQQRMEHKNRFDGKSSSLNDGRLARLQSIGFRWAKRKGQASWEEKFVSLPIVNVHDW